MFKRLFFAMVGLGGGLALGIWGVRKLEATQRALNPGQIAGSLGGRLAAAMEAGRQAMADKEAELRAEHGVAAPATVSRLYAGGAGAWPDAGRNPGAGQWASDAGRNPGASQFPPD